MAKRAAWAVLAAALLVVAAACGGEPSTEASAEGAAAATAAQEIPGKQNYLTHCASCHGVNGEGQPNWLIPGPDGIPLAPPHDNTGHTWHHGDGYLFEVTKHGGVDFQLPGRPSGMPGFDAQMTDQEIRDVILYIKRFWGADEREVQATASQWDPFW